MVNTALSSTLNKRELERLVSRLNRIGIALSSEHQLHRLLDLIVSEARSITNADGGSLYVRDGDKLKFAVSQTKSLNGRNGMVAGFQASSLPLTKESIGGYVAITGTILNIRDAYKIPAHVEYRLNRDFDIKMNYRSKSMLVVPLRDHTDEIIGVLQLINSLDDNGRTVAFKKEHETLIHSIASQAAVAIRNAQLIENIQGVFRALVRYSVKAIDARSPSTAGHSGRVADYSVALMRAVNHCETGPLADTFFTAAEIEEMRIASWLHDIGKIGVHESILEKKHKLTDDQLKVIEYRFDMIKTLEQARSEQKKIQLLQSGRLHSDRMKMLDVNLKNVLNKIDDDLEFIRQINSPEMKIKHWRIRIDQIAQKSYEDLAGIKCAYLTNAEVAILSVPKGTLTDKEFAEMQGHVKKTLAILENIPFSKDLENVPKIAAVHHERLDGSGYPFKLKANEINIQGRIIAICDIFDALTAKDRPYKKAVSIPETLAILVKEAKDGRIDKDLVDIFISEKIYECEMSNGTLK
ncbi:GAF domain-containing protein [candidate division KSB1 bacterium]|nr:GAF domain-containing protein [candidate division KSB1 bacterium]